MSGQGDTKNDERRGGTLHFISVFAACVLFLLAGYRYLIRSPLNDMYLYSVAWCTTCMLDVIGDSAELETCPLTSDGTSVTPAEARASLEAWRAGHDSAAPAEVLAAPNTPLNTWERWLYRAESSRRGCEERSSGPHVVFVWRASVQDNLMRAEEALAQVRQAPESAARDADMASLGAQRDALKEQVKAEMQKKTPVPHYRFSFIVVSECGAIEVMAIFLAAVLAFPASWGRRLFGIVAGIPIMYGVNVFRLTCLGIIGALDQTRGRAVFDFAHHYVWQAVYIVFVVAVWLAWVELIVRRGERMAFEAQPVSTRAAILRGLRATLRFSAAFLVLICVVTPLWWELLPYYGYVLVQVSGVLLRFVMRVPIEAGWIDTQGVLNTASTLTFQIAGLEGTKTSPLALLITNVPPYIALIMATGGLRLARRVKILAYGCGILMAGHVLFLVVVLKYQEALRAYDYLPMAVIQFYLTMPFLLWLVFAYLDKNRRDTGGTPPKEEPPSVPPPAAESETPSGQA